MRVGRSMVGDFAPKDAILIVARMLCCKYGVFDTDTVLYLFMLFRAAGFALWYSRICP